MRDRTVPAGKTDGAMTDDLPPDERGEELLLVPAAVALVALVLVGAGVFALVNRDSDNSSTTARSRTTEAGPPREGGSAPDASSSAEAVTGVRDLGELGDVTDAGELRRRVRMQLDEAPASSRAARPPASSAPSPAAQPPPRTGPGRIGTGPCSCSSCRRTATDPPSCCSTRGRAGRSRSSTWPESSRPSAGTLAGFSDGTKEP
jgi:hypothetical protein